jgi:tetratricopeptide (TPR) repeat protein
VHLDPEAMGTLLSAVPSEPLAHLLACARCRRRLSGLVVDLGSREEGLDAEGMVPAVEASPATSQRVLLRAIELAQAREGREEAEEDRRHFDELLRLAPDQRTSAIGSQRRFQTLGLAEILVSAARQDLDEDPRRSRHLAGLGVFLLDRLEESAGSRQLGAAATVLLAEVERRVGRPDVAEDLLKQAAVELQDEPLVLEARVSLCRTWAALRRDQGRLDEALALLERASAIAEELGSYQELARLRLTEGWLLLDELEPERALLPLREALAHFESAEDPHALLSVLQAFALVYAETHDDDRLADVETRIEALGLRFSDPLDQVRVRWVHARIHRARSQREAAIALLEEVFHRLAAEGPGHEAALAGLELARSLAEAEEGATRPDALRGIAGVLADLPPDRLPSHLVAPILFALRLAAQREGAFQDALLAASAYVERGRFNPERVFHPTSNPDLFLLWHDLTPRQRRQAAEAAMVGVDAAGEPRSREDLRLISWTHEALTGVRIEIPEGLGGDDGTA